MSPWPVIGQAFLQALTLVFMLAGLVGMLIPIFPGEAVIWLAALVYALVEYFAGNMGVWGWVCFGLITILMIAGMFVDEIVITRKLRETGTPWQSIFISYTVALVASLFLTPLASLFITPLALYGIEYWRLRAPLPAFQSVQGWLIGFGWTLLAELALGAAMIGLWMLWAWVL